MKSKKYHNVGTFPPKNTTLSEHFLPKTPHCRNISIQKYVPTVWYLLEEMFRQCGIFGGKCSDSVVFFGGNVPTVWYFLGGNVQTVWYFLWECSDSVVFFAFHFIICTEQEKIYCLYFSMLPSNYYLIFTCDFNFLWRKPLTCRKLLTNFIT
jgi:hypothetical protein